MDSGLLASLGPGMTKNRFGPIVSLPRKFQSHLPVALRVVAPAFAHFDEEEEVDRVLDRRGDVDARRRADGLDGLPAFAEHDLALAFALDIDRLFDAHGAVFQLLPDLGFH